jgi:hypothetical protein
LGLSIGFALFVVAVIIVYFCWRWPRQHELFRFILSTPDPIPKTCYSIRRARLRWQTSGACLTSSGCSSFDAFSKSVADCCSSIFRNDIQYIDAPEGSEFYEFVKSKMRKAPPGTTISRVEMVFTGRGQDFCRRIEAESGEIARRNPRFIPEKPSDLNINFHEGLKHFDENCEKTLPGICDRAKVIFAWHGTPAIFIKDICSGEIKAFGETDAGYFGVGIYTALECAYAARYSEYKSALPNANGEFGVILFACYLGPWPYVITLDSDYDNIAKGVSRFCGPSRQSGIALQPLYDSHFVPVKFYGYNHPITGVVQAYYLDYQACSQNDPACEGHELVLNDGSQLLPVAVLWYKKNATT